MQLLTYAALFHSLIAPEIFLSSSNDDTQTHGEATRWAMGSSTNLIRYYVVDRPSAAKSLPRHHALSASGCGSAFRFASRVGGGAGARVTYLASAEAVSAALAVTRYRRHLHRFLH